MLKADSSHKQALACLDYWDTHMLCTKGGSSFNCSVSDGAVHLTHGIQRRYLTTNRDIPPSADPVLLPDAQAIKHWTLEQLQMQPLPV